MSLRVTIGFLAAAVVLGALVFGLDKFNIGPTATAKANATATTTASQTPQIFSFDDTKVTAFELHQGDSSVRIEKQTDTWVVAATGANANRTSFNSLILRMSTLKATRQVDNPNSDLSQYGLDPVKESAVAELNDGTKYQLDVGSKTPIQSGTYAKKADAPDVFVVGDQFVTDLERLVANPNELPTPTPAPPTVPPTAAPAPELTPTTAP